jgi:hypothetical protein
LSTDNEISVAWEYIFQNGIKCAVEQVGSRLPLVLRNVRYFSAAIEGSQTCTRNHRGSDVAESKMCAVLAAAVEEKEDSQQSPLDIRVQQRPEFADVDDAANTVSATTYDDSNGSGCHDLTTSDLVFPFSTEHHTNFDSSSDFSSPVSSVDGRGCESLPDAFDDDASHLEEWFAEFSALVGLGERLEPAATDIQTGGDCARSSGLVLSSPGLVRSESVCYSMSQVQVACNGASLYLNSPFSSDSSTSTSSSTCSSPASGGFIEVGDNICDDCCMPFWSSRAGATTSTSAKSSESNQHDAASIKPRSCGARPDRSIYLRRAII